MTPERALTTVDLPCATWPMVPMLMVACATAAVAAADYSAADNQWDHGLRTLPKAGARQAHQFGRGATMPARNGRGARG
jgi:hypothetical protein